MSVRNNKKIFNLTQKILNVQNQKKNYFKLIIGIFC